MKKLLSLLLALSLVLVACSTGGEVTKMTKDDGQGNVSTVELHSEGDKVTRQISENVFDSAYLSVTEDMLTENLDQFKNSYNSVDGISYDYKIDENGIITETIDVDYNNIDWDGYGQLDGVILEGDPQNGISLEKTVGLFEESGFTKAE